MDYIKLYRIDRKSLDKEVLQFIQNHDSDSTIENRDFKLCILLKENYYDPLSYLNEFIDIIAPYWKVTMTQPAILYVSPITLRSRQLHASTQVFKTMSDIKHWFKNFKKDIYPYTLSFDPNSFHKYTFRSAQVESEEKII